MRGLKAEFVQFPCEGCGTIVTMFGTDKVPDGHFCLTCGFIEWSIPDLTVRQGLHEHLGTMRKLELRP